MIIKKSRLEGLELSAIKFKEHGPASAAPPGSAPPPSAAARHAPSHPGGGPAGHDENLALVAQRAMQQAQERAMMLEKEAYEKGFAQGDRAGRETAEKKADALLKRCAATIDEVTKTKADALQKAEREVVKLAFSLAHRILQREVQVDPELILTMCRIGMSRIGEKSLVTIRLNPADHKIVNDNRSKLAPPSEQAGITLVEDPTISRGGCLIETDMGSVDARLDEQLREVERAITGK